MKILAVCLGSAETLPGKKYKTGINKLPVSGPVMVDSEGFVGDRICNRKHHGGVDQAVYLEGSLTLDWWSNQLGRQLAPGEFGENLIVEGLDNRDVAAGDRFLIGDVLLEVTSARMPCATFATKMQDPRFVRRYTEAARPGAYARVLAGGLIERGMAVAVSPYAGDRIMLPEMMETFGRRLEGDDRDRYLAAPVHYRLKAFLTA